MTMKILMADVIMIWLFLDMPSKEQQWQIRLSTPPPSFDAVLFFFLVVDDSMVDCGWFTSPSLPNEYIGGGHVGVGNGTGLDGEDDRLENHRGVAH